MLGPYPSTPNNNIHALLIDGFRINSNREKAVISAQPHTSSCTRYQCCGSLPCYQKTAKKAHRLPSLQSLAKFPHSPILHYASGSMCVVLCFATKKQQKTAHGPIAMTLFLPLFSVNLLSPGLKLQILLLCFHTFLTEVVGRSCQNINGI